PALSQGEPHTSSRRHRSCRPPHRNSRTRVGWGDRELLGSAASRSECKTASPDVPGPGTEGKGESRRATHTDVPFYLSQDINDSAARHSSEGESFART